jgi:hypothetical protein
LQEIKAATGGKGRVEDGSIAADKPLAQVLQDAKDAKEAAFQEGWKQMKVGKNRPLDEDEMGFLDSLAEAEAEQQRQVAREEADELAAYHQVSAGVFLCALDFFFNVTSAIKNLLVIYSSKIIFMSMCRLFGSTRN